MEMKSVRILSALVAVSLFGCSVGTDLKPIPLEESRAYSASYEDTFKATAIALTSLNFSLTIAEKDIGIINTNSIDTSYAQPLTFVSAHKYGTRNAAWSDREVVSAKAIVKGDDKQSTVSISLNINELSRSGSITVGSKGILEKEIYDLIGKNLGLNTEIMATAN